MEREVSRLDSAFRKEVAVMTESVIIGIYHIVCTSKETIAGWNQIPLQIAGQQLRLLLPILRPMGLQGHPLAQAILAQVRRFDSRPFPARNRIAFCPLG